MAETPETLCKKCKEKENKVKKPKKAVVKKCYMLKNNVDKIMGIYSSKKSATLDNPKGKYEVETVIMK